MRAQSLRQGTYDWGTETRMIAACWIALLTLTVAGYARGTCMRYEKEGGSNTGNGVETLGESVFYLLAHV